MPRNSYQINLVPQDAREAILFEEINRNLRAIADEAARMQGLDGHTPSFANDVDFGGKRIMGVGRTREDGDVPGRGELRQNALYKNQQGKHIATGPIIAEQSIMVPVATVLEQAIPLSQLAEALGGSAATAAPGEVEDASALGSVVARFAREDHTHAGVNKTDAQTGIAGAKTWSDKATFSSEVELDGALNHDGTTVGFYGTAPQTQGTAIADLTDNSGGTANDTIQALTDPADTPASADALRDDLVANLIPELRNNFADLAAKVDAITDRLRRTGYIAT